MSNYQGFALSKITKDDKLDLDNITSEGKNITIAGDITIGGTLYGGGITGGTGLSAGQQLILDNLSASDSNLITDASLNVSAALNVTGISTIPTVVSNNIQSNDAVNGIVVKSQNSANHIALLNNSVQIRGDIVPFGSNLTLKSPNLTNTLSLSDTDIKLITPVSITGDMILTGQIDATGSVLANQMFNFGQTTTGDLSVTEKINCSDIESVGQDLKLATDQDVWISGQTIRLNGDVLMTGNVSTYSEVEILDPLLKVGFNNNTSDLMNLGVYGVYFDGSTMRYSGIVRDYFSKEFYLCDTSTEPTIANNIAALGRASLNVHNLHCFNDSTVLGFSQAEKFWSTTQNGVDRMARMSSAAINTIPQGSGQASESCICLNSTTKKIQYNDGSNWLELQSAAVGKPYILPTLAMDTRAALTPIEGQMCFNSTTKKMEFYDGTKWQNTFGVSVLLEPFSPIAPMPPLDNLNPIVVSDVEDQTVTFTGSQYIAGVRYHFSYALNGLSSDFVAVDDSKAWVCGGYDLTSGFYTGAVQDTLYDGAIIARGNWLDIKFSDYPKKMDNYVLKMGDVPAYVPLSYVMLGSRDDGFSWESMHAEKVSTGSELLAFATVVTTCTNKTAYLRYRWVCTAVKAANSYGLMSIVELEPRLFATSPLRMT